MSDVVNVQSTLFFETPEQIFLRVFSVIRPRTAVPMMTVKFCPFANANSFIRLEAGILEVRLTDVLRDAPAPILEALAFILISKLYRRPVPRSYSHRYRLYLNRKDVRHALHGVRKERGRKQIRHPKGKWFDLVELFEDLNIRYFHGLMTRPALGWSARPSRTTLGHYDPSHHMIVLSRVLDQEKVPRLAIEYVMFHEMLHLRYPVDHRGARRCVHTPDFKLAEKEFEQLREAKEMLKHLP
ncbi:MAG TPA: SprT-like domain-containing protein [Bryobacteraceae bacterium]|nr:SprT-like domain-containing protein [Bryobacteraceae bacterium]